MDSLPLFSVDLIKQLDEEYPNRWPLMTMTDREIWFKAGQRAVVDSLKTLQKHLEEDEKEKGTVKNVSS